MKAKVDKKIDLTIEIPVFGDVYVDNAEIDQDGILSIPLKSFPRNTDNVYKVSLEWLVEEDVRFFEKLNKASDENHQVYLDTLTIYGVHISGNYIRIKYWFDQYKDGSCHRMCAGNINHFTQTHNTSSYGQALLPDCYSSGVCVYW